MVPAVLRGEAMQQKRLPEIAIDQWTYVAGVKAGQ
jgi:hypothetical protein